MAVAGAALLAAAAGTTALAAGGHGGRQAATSAPGGQPVAWDPRILPIARFVERDRHLTFTHPVVVRFLPTATFEQQVERSDAVSAAAPAGGGGPTDAQQAAELRALGVASGPLDLGAASAQADAASTVGYYDDQTKALYVEGTSLTPYVRVTVAHELTHALQDQRLDLSSLDRRPDDQQQAISALVEGDATVVEGDYRATLSAADEGAYEREAADAGGPAPTSGAAGYPDFLGDQGDFPYSLGPAFVDALYDHGGDDAVDRAFRDPPTTEAQIADPSRYLDHVTATAVAAPALPAGARPLVDLGAFGQVSLADVLGTRVGYAAWAALAGWRGDHAALYARAGRTCVAISTATSDPASLAATARTWAAGLPAAATPTVAAAAGGSVELTSCDPGPAARQADPVAPSAYDGIVARADLLDDMLTADGPPPAPVAECAADRVVGSLGVAGAVAYDQGERGAPGHTRVAELEKAAERACAGAT